MTLLRWLQAFNKKPTRSVIGLMSGTSLDGIDAAWVEISGSGASLQAQLRGFISVPFAPDLRARLLDLCRNSNVEEAAVTNVELGELFAQAALQLMKDCGLTTRDVDLIGSHGQTICHLPNRGASLQIGEPCVIAERTGITTVADFRARDLAAGGEGAPLVPYVDWCLLQRAERHRIAQNIGGIANCTLLPAGGVLEDARAWDTGPGNMVMDEAMRILTDNRQHFDLDGRVANRGKVDEAWLDELMRHPFFHRAPPKSAGREEFGQAYSQAFVAEGQKRGLNASDIMATATALSAASIAHSYHAHAEPYLRSRNAELPVEVIVGGGGAFNPTLRQMLSERLATSDVSYSVLSNEEIGMRSDAREAIAFAILAHEAITGTPCNVPGATGAKRRVVLGKIIPGRFDD